MKKSPNSYIQIQRNGHDFVITGTTIGREIAYFAQGGHPAVPTFYVVDILKKHKTLRSCKVHIGDEDDLKLAEVRRAIISKNNITIDYVLNGEEGTLNFPNQKSRPPTDLYLGLTYTLDRLSESHGSK